MNATSATSSLLLRGAIVCTRTVQLRQLIAALGVLAWTSSAASGAAVTLEDLQGVDVTVSTTVQEKIVRNGEIRYPQLITTGRVHIGPGDSISVSFQSSSGQKTGNVQSGTYHLGKAQKSRGGDDMLWLFADGSLIRLFAYGTEGSTGGQKLTINFRRSGNGLSCTILRPISREVGRSDVEKPSSVDGVPIRILSFQQIASSCEVSKP